MNKLILIFLASFLFGCNNQSESSHLNQNKVSKEDMITNNLDKNSIMNEEEFWEIISQSSNNGNKAYKEQLEVLKEILIKKDESTIIKFNNTLYSLLNGSYNWDLWAASYVINGGCSDDCFDYFREYLISKGKSRFYSTLKDPDSCAEWILSEGQENWQGLGTVPMLVYKEKTGKDLQLSIPPRKELNNEEGFDELTLGEKYPKLAAKFGF